MEDEYWQLLSPEKLSSDIFDIYMSVEIPEWVQGVAVEWKREAPRRLKAMVVGQCLRRLAKTKTAREERREGTGPASVDLPRRWIDWALHGLASLRMLGWLERFVQYEKRMVDATYETKVKVIEEHYHVCPAPPPQYARSGKRFDWYLYRMADAELPPHEEYDLLVKLAESVPVDLLFSNRHLDQDRIGALLIAYGKWKSLSSTGGLNV